MLLKDAIPKQPKCQWSLNFQARNDSGHYPGKTQIKNTKLATKQR